MTRDAASRFNQAFCTEDDPLLPLPEPLILEDVAVYSADASELVEIS